MSDHSTPDPEGPVRGSGTASDSGSEPVPNAERPTAKSPARGRRRPGLSPAMEDYVRAIHHLRQDGGAVSTTALARYMAVAPASVTGMLKRLDRMGLVEHRRYGGAKLTGAGERVARELVRHHRIIETYLAEALGLSWDLVHEEANRLEHHVSARVGERMAHALGQPARDPHGAPIPGADDDEPFVEPRYSTLDAADQGQRVVVREVADESPEHLRKLARLGMRPGVRVTVTRAAHASTLIVHIEGSPDAHEIPRDLAAIVSVEDAA